jgi:dihydrofolate reductase
VLALLQLLLLVKHHVYVTRVYQEVAALFAVDEAGGFGHRGGLPWPRNDSDMAHFVALTKAPRFPGVLNAVIMGRNTWASLPASRRPLPGRINVVVSSESLFPAGAGDAANADTPVLSAATLHDAVQAAEARQAGVAFLIGGATLLREALSPECDLVTVVYRTRISGVFEASVKLMDMDLRPFSLVASMVRVKVLEFSGFAMDNVGVLVGKVCECVCVCVCVCCQPGTGCTFDMLRRCRVVAPAPAPLPLSEEVQYLDLARCVLCVR